MTGKEGEETHTGTTKRMSNDVTTKRMSKEVTTFKRSLYINQIGCNSFQRKKKERRMDMKARLL